MLQVIGGSGLLGSAIIRALNKRGEASVHNADIRPAHPSLALEGASFHSVDITSFESVNNVLAKVNPAVVYHTASPLAQTSERELLEKVNVHGTANIIRACQQNDVKALVFTSSASVVFDGHDLINVDERMPYAETPFDLYSETKARGEHLVLSANTDEGSQGLKTVSLRPAGIFGPHDRQAIPGFMQALKTGKHNIQLGDNKNLFDWTYVDNVAHAHLLAADKLTLNAKPYSRELLASVHLSTRSTGQQENYSFLERDVPTSEKRPDVAGAHDYARDLLEPGSKETISSIDIRPVIRNRYDQFFHIVNPEVPSPGNPIPETVSIAGESIKVAGEAFFITNGQPVPFWDFPRALWRAYDPENGVVDPKKVWHIGKDVALPLASLAQGWSWLFGKQSQFTRFRVTLCTASRYHNIEKARRALGYEPLVGMEEAVRLSAQAFRDEETRLGEK